MFLRHIRKITDIQATTTKREAERICKYVSRQTALPLFKHNDFCFSKRIVLGNFKTQGQKSNPTKVIGREGITKDLGWCAGVKAHSTEQQDKNRCPGHKTEKHLDLLILKQPWLGNDARQVSVRTKPSTKTGSTCVTDRFLAAKRKARTPTISPTLY